MPLYPDITLVKRSAGTNPIPAVDNDQNMDNIISWINTKIRDVLQTHQDDITALQGSVLKQGKTTIPVLAYGMVRRSGTNGANLTFNEQTGGFVVASMDFSNSAPDNYVQITIPMSKNWNEATTISLQLGWTATASSGAVTWKAKATTFSANESMVSPTFGATSTIVQSISGAEVTARANKVTAETNLAIGGSVAENDFLAIQIWRDTTAVGLASNAKLIWAKIFITTNAATDA